MRLLPSQQKNAIERAIKEFEKNGKLSIFEPCDCGSRVQHNNGGNYHEEIYLSKDSGQAFVKYETTCELIDPAEWEICDDWQKVITDHADWL